MAAKGAFVAELGAALRAEFAAFAVAGGGEGGEAGADGGQQQRVVDGASGLVGGGDVAALAAADPKRSKCSVIAPGDPKR